MMAKSMKKNTSIETLQLSNSASEIANSVISAEKRALQQEHPKSAAKRFRVVRQVLTDAEQEELRQQFPEYQLNFTNKVVQAHAYAAASRSLEAEVLLDKIGDINGKIIDVGGNWAEHVIAKRLHVHSCCPILDYRDAARQKEREIRLEKFAAVNAANKRTSPGFELYQKDKYQIVCHNRAEACKFTARAVMFLHSTYDIPFDTLAKIMGAHNAEIAYGCFIFSPQILLQSTGRISGVNAYYEVDKMNNRIRFTFCGDSSNGYEHSYSQYLMYLARTTVTYAGMTYYYELLEYRAGIQFFKLVRCDLQPECKSRMFRHIWLGLDGLIEVRLFDYGVDPAVRIGTGDVSDLTCERVFLPERLVATALEYAYAKMTGGNGDMKTCDLFNYLRSFNNRVIVCGTSVSVPESVGPQVLQKLASVLYITAYVNVLRQERVVSTLRNHAHSVADLLRKSNASLIARVIKVFLTGTDHRFDIQTDGPKLRMWLLEHCKEDFSAHIRDPYPFVRFSEVRDLYFAEQFKGASSQFLSEWATILRKDDSWFYGLGQRAQEIISVALRTVALVLPALAGPIGSYCFDKALEHVITSEDRLERKHEVGFKAMCPQRQISTEFAVEARAIKGLRHSAEVLLASGAIRVDSFEQAIMNKPIIIGTTAKFEDPKIRMLKRRYRTLVAKNRYGWSSANGSWNLCSLDAIWQLVKEQTEIVLDETCEKSFYRTFSFHLYLLQAIINYGTSETVQVDNFDMMHLAIVLNRFGIFTGGIIHEPDDPTRAATIVYFSSADDVVEPFEIWLMLRRSHYYYFDNCGENDAPIYAELQELELTGRESIGSVLQFITSRTNFPEFILENLHCRTVADLFVMDSNHYMDRIIRIHENRFDYRNDPQFVVEIRDGDWYVELIPTTNYKDELSDLDYPWMRSILRKFAITTKLPVRMSDLFRLEFAQVSEPVRSKFKKWLDNIYVQVEGLDSYLLPIFEIDRLSGLNLVGKIPSGLHMLVICNDDRTFFSTMDLLAKYYRKVVSLSYLHFERIEGFNIDQYSNLKSIGTVTGTVFSEISTQHLLFHLQKVNFVLIDLIQWGEKENLQQLIERIHTIISRLDRSLIGDAVFVIRTSIQFEISVLQKFLNCFGIVDYYKPSSSPLLDDEIFVVVQKFEDETIGFSDLQYDDFVASVWRKRLNHLQIFKNNEPVPRISADILDFIMHVQDLRRLTLLNTSEISRATGGGITSESDLSTSGSSVKSKAKKRRERKKRMIERLRAARDDLARIAAKDIIAGDSEIESIAQVVGQISIEEDQQSVELQTDRNLSVSANSQDLQIESPRIEVISAQCEESIEPERVELKIYSEYAQRQDARVAEYRLYLEAERANVTATARTIFDALFGKGLQGKYVDASSKHLEFEKTHKLFVLSRSTQAFVYVPWIYNSEIISGTYDVCFDGDQFVSIELVPTQNKKPWYIVPSTRPFVIVFEDLRVYQSERLLNTVFRRNYRAHGAEITLVEGVPGSGKTTEIISRATKRDIILTVAKRTRDEIQERIVQYSEKIGVEIRTVDSYLINSKRTAKNIYLDEGLMLHPGQIDLVASKACATNVFVFGDRAQLNFISRVGGFEVKFREYSDFIRYEFRNITYRCPMDVAAALFSKYAAGMYSKSNVRKSMQIQPITSLYDVPKKPNVKYLVYTQQEKHDMLRKGFNVNTIHECQGMTFSHVAMVRLLPLQLALYDSISHGLVAVSRHTKSFVYYTVAANSTVARDSVWNFVNAVTDVDRVVDMNKAKSQLQLANKIAVVKRQEFITEIRPVCYTYEFESDCDYFARTPQVAQVIKDLSNKLHVLPGSRWPVDLIRQDRLLPSVFAFPEISKIDYKTMNSAGIVAALQKFYDEAFPEASGDFHTFDEMQIETSDLNVYLNDVRFSLSRLGENLHRTEVEYSYLPRLRTGQPNARPRTVRQDLLALAKRNCDVPRNSVAVDEQYELRKTFTCFLQTYCVPGAEAMLESFRTSPITCDTNTLMRWLNEQDPQKISRIDLVSEFNSVLEFVRYEMMIKTEAKNKLDPAAIYEYLPVQNIVFHRPIVNALMGSIFKQLFDRFLQILKPNVFCLLKKSFYELQVHLNLCLLPGRPYQRLEIDFSKFDKSQARMCHLFEMCFWEELGMDQYLNGLWRAGHYTSSALDFSTGVKAYLMYQRKSGDAATAFGNTLVAMAALARSADITGFATAMFVGDDSLIYFPQHRHFENVLKNLADIFNLSAKIFEKKYGYFCSAFIIPVADGYLPIPDPLKRIERLGRGLVGIDIHGLKDRQISFSELMQNLFVAGVDEVLQEAMAERYMIGSGFAAAMTALRHLVLYPDLFVAMYKPQQSVIVSKLKKVKEKLRL